jgi:hypothetical protein
MMKTRQEERERGEKEVFCHYSLGREEREDKREDEDYPWT